MVQVLSTEWAALSDATGRFALLLPDGEWAIEVSRIGYRSDTVRVRVPSVGAAGLEVVLVEEPLALKGVTVRARSTPPLGASVTTETVRQVPPLAEPDIFRALTLLPHVTQPNELKGRIHLAGGSSDETGIRLDGHPLQEPFHMLGVMGAFNVAALERADVLTHYLPASHGGRLSGVLDLRTRRPRPEGKGEIVASLLAGGITINEPLPLGLDVLASGRVSYMGEVIDALQASAPSYGFRDGLLRLGGGFGGWRAEVIGFATRDRFDDAAPEERPVTWGETLAGLRVRRSGTRWSFLGRASFNRARLDFDYGTAPDTGGFSQPPPVQGPPLMHTVRDWATAAAELQRVWRTTRVTVGLEADLRRNAQRWRAEEVVAEVLTPNTPAVFAGRESHAVLSPYVQGRVTLGNAWLLSAGLRVPIHRGTATMAPRLLLERRSGAARFSVAAGRRVQFDAQAEEPIEGSITAPLFLLDDPRVADVVGAAVEWPRLEAPFGGRARLRIEGFAKRYPDRPLLRRTQGSDTLMLEFPQFDRVNGRAYGGSVSAVAEFGGILLQGSYSYQRAIEEYRPGEWSPTSWDAPHTLKALGSVSIGRGWTANVVFRAHSGRAVTPVEARIWEPVSPNDLASRYLLGDRNSARVPPYHRMDLGLRYNGQIGSVEWVFAAQVLNLLNRTNPIDYVWSQYFARLHHGRDSGGHRAGFPVLPSLGLEVRW